MFTRNQIYKYYGRSVKYKGFEMGFHRFFFDNGALLLIDNNHLYLIR